MTTPKPPAHPPCTLPPGTFRLTRRDLVKATGLGLSGGLVAELALAAPDPAKAFPVTKVADLDDLKVDVPLSFSYPDDSSPAVLLRLRGPATGGVGPGSTIVAFSQLCTHKGCPVTYRPERKLIICPCHWSTFDPSKGGQMVIGQASQALPQIQLRITDNAIFAVGVDGLIFGRHTNVL